MSTWLTGTLGCQGLGTVCQLWCRGRDEVYVRKGPPKINGVSIDHIAHNDVFLPHCTRQQYEPNTYMLQTTANISQWVTSRGGVAFGMAQILLCHYPAILGFTWHYIVRQNITLIL